MPPEQQRNTQDGRQGSPSWEVRPFLFVDPGTTVEDMRRVEAHLRSALPVAKGTLAIGPKGGVALGATLVLGAATAGGAADRALELLARACAATGIGTHGFQEVTVTTTRDPRDW
ncbi:MAG TPA: hypothetical protein VGC06_05270 [Actinomycetes bacterium]